MRNKLCEVLFENKNTYLNHKQLFEKVLNVNTDNIPASLINNTTTRRTITKIINQLNNSMDFEKIIVSTKKGMKLANEEEATKYVKKLYAQAFKKLKYARTLEKKVNLNGQLDFGFNEFKTFISEENK